MLRTHGRRAEKPDDGRDDAHERTSPAVAQGSVMGHRNAPVRTGRPAGDEGQGGSCAPGREPSSTPKRPIRGPTRGAHAYLTTIVPVIEEWMVQW